MLGYKVNSGQHSSVAKGRRPEGGRVVHVVCASTTVSLLQSLMADKLGPQFSGDEFEVQVFITVPLLFSLSLSTFRSLLSFVCSLSL